MPQDDFRLVDIVRDFLLADTLTRRLFDRHRSGALRFEEVEGLVGDAETSVLFRLKERCHAAFRPDARGALVSPREALFDLAVGSLFHEAMKFRENLYQHTVYGPKVRALRAEAGAGVDELFGEFEKILASAAERLDEAVQETETLLARTRVQFHVLLVAHRENGLVARYLIENAPLVEEVFPHGLDALLADIHGTAAEGFAVAARSYLASGHFAPGLRVLAEARRRSEGTDAELARLEAYANGMELYLKGHYAESLQALERWVELGPTEAEGDLADLAHTALERLDALVEGPSAPALVEGANRLAERIQPLAPRARALLRAAGT